MAQLVREPIDTQALLQSVTTAQAGAAVLFVGTTREITQGRRTLWLDYDGYSAMALEKLNELERLATERWKLVGCAIVHRLGRVGLAETSVAIAVSSAHRHDAFAAGQWLIDTLKQVVPIWKKENWDDGTTEWVHPGVPGSITTGPSKNLSP